jgi:predicted alpha/beta hydrolase family esterase
MRQVLFVQGAGKDVHRAWDNLLVDSLRHALGPRFEVRYPAMPNEADPTFASWRAALVPELATLRDGAVAVGHSVGGTILINVLAEQRTNAALGAIVLIAAPFIGEGGWSTNDLAACSDLGARLPSAVPVFLFYGDADTTVPIAHAELYARAIPRAHVRRLPGRDHQLDNDLAEVARDIHDLE